MASNQHISSLYLNTRQVTHSSQSLDTSIKCLMCDHIVDNNSENQSQPSTESSAQSLQKHLLTKHKLMIADIESIAYLNRYCDYWRPKFAESRHDLSRICALINTNCGPKDVLSSQTYYMIGGSETQFPEDSELRKRLNESLLESILLQSELERNDDSFQRNCIFCRKLFETNRINLFNHLANDHNFNVGHPDNIVNCMQLLDVLDHKLSQLQCLYCEKTFKSWPILKEHMRKKGHKLLNPNNRDYDKYYLINYLSPEKDWREVKHELDLDLNNSCEQNEWNDWSEEDCDQQNRCICLFCQFSEQIIELKTHLNSIHSFDFDSNVLSLDFYSRIKSINYIRRSVHQKRCHKCEQSFATSDELLVHLDFSGHIRQMPDECQYDSPEYYFSTYENDNLLHFLDNTGIDDTEQEEEQTICSDSHNLSAKAPQLTSN